MNKPFIGQQLWYRQGTVREIASLSLSDQPFAATVVHVNEDETVNLLVLDHLAKQHFVTNCNTEQDGDKAYCEPMACQNAPAAPAKKAKVAT